MGELPNLEPKRRPDTEQSHLLKMDAPISMGPSTMSKPNRIKETTRTYGTTRADTHAPANAYACESPRAHIRGHKNACAQTHAHT